jgi:5-formyltetrahydrofolate cyclo-ligase
MQQVLPRAGHAVAIQKRELRRMMRARRDAIELEPARACAQAAAAQALGLPEIAGAALIGLYAPVASELDTGPLAAALRARDIGLAYPRVLLGQRRLLFHRVASPDLLVPGAFGIPEPAAGAPVVPAEAIDAFIVPGLAFDAHGHRLGWGHGYYDAILASAPRGLRLGFAYDCQVVAEVPCAPTDVAMDRVITEAGVKRCRDRTTARR